MLQDELSDFFIFTKAFIHQKIKSLFENRFAAIENVDRNSNRNNRVQKRKPSPLHKNQGEKHPSIGQKIHLVMHEISFDDQTFCLFTYALKQKNNQPRDEERKEHNEDSACDFRDFWISKELFD